MMNQEIPSPDRGKAPPPRPAIPAGAPVEGIRAGARALVSPGSVAGRHWPKAGALLAAGSAIAWSLSQGRIDLFGLVLVTVLFGGVAYFALTSFRKSLSNLHGVRSRLIGSPAFLVGAVAGLAYFVYATFVNPAAFGSGWGGHATLQDGFRQAGLGAAALLLLKAAGHVVAGGLLVEVLSRRFSGAGKAESGEKNAR